MNYVEIDFNDVKGYNKLSQPAKNLFEWTYKSHNSGQGLDYKKDWIPIKVKERKTFIEVHFANGKWLHYFPGGTWG